MVPISRIIIITPYPKNLSPSQRFRLELFLKPEKAKNIEFHQLSFLSEGSFKNFYHANPTAQFLIILISFLKRIFHLTYLRLADFVFIHREYTPVGPPIFEWLIAKIFQKKIIYDFDDAIWLEDPEEKGTFKSWLKAKWKIKWIIRWSYKVSAGNEYLAEYARMYNSHVRIIPTVVDTRNYHNPNLFDPPENKIPVIGWTGSHTTLQYLDPVIPILEELSQEINFELLIIANKPPEFKMKNLRFIPWKRETEIEDLMKIDIGIMPLTDDEWSKGKCGFKLIQYLALEIPGVASRVGVNSNIIADGKSGFLCSSPEEWKRNLKALLLNPELRKTMGQYGRRHVEENYSVVANSESFFSLFE